MLELVLATSVFLLTADRPQTPDVTMPGEDSAEPAKAAKGKAKGGLDQQV